MELGIYMVGVFCVVLFSSEMQTRPPFAIKMEDYWWVSQMSHTSKIKKSLGDFGDKIERHFGQHGVYCSDNIYGLFCGMISFCQRTKEYQMKTLGSSSNHM